MHCPRCAAEVPDGPSRWCQDCELQFDGWVRRHATDIVWQVLVGTVIVSTFGLVLPLLGVGELVGAAAAFAGFGSIYGLSRLTRRKRRHQFLVSSLPRAYLPAPK